MWSVPRELAGRTVAVLASGPSMSAAVADAVRAAGAAAVAVNSTFRLAPWAWALYAADEEWWHHPANGDAKRFAGHKISVSRVHGVHGLANTGPLGFDPDPRCIRTGGNSGYQAVHVAAHAGAGRILLCGFDMHGPGEHWHGAHPAGLRETTVCTFSSWVERFASIAEPLRARGIEVLNCTPGSSLTCFPTADLEDALAGAVQAA